MRIIVSLLFVFSMLGASVGKLSLTIGKVEVLRGEIVLQGKSNMELEKKDEVFTKNGKAQIIFNDKSVVTIGKNTNFVIQDYVRDGKNSKADFRVFNGTFKVITGAIGKVAPKKFKIKTRTATIGIRGTIIVGDISKKHELIGCTDGEIDVQKTWEKSKIRVVKAGQMMNVSDKSPKVKPIEAGSFKVLSRLSNTLSSDTKRIESNTKTLDSSSVVDHMSSSKTPKADQQTASFKIIFPHASIKDSFGGVDMKKYNENVEQSDAIFNSIGKEIKGLVATSQGNHNLEEKISSFKQKQKEILFKGYYDGGEFTGTDGVTIKHVKAPLILELTPHLNKVAITPYKHKYHGTSAFAKIQTVSGAPITFNLTKPLSTGELYAVEYWQKYPTKEKKYIKAKFYGQDAAYIKGEALDKSETNTLYEFVVKQHK